LEAARRSGFKSISIDLIYGLPLQTVDGFNRTLDRIIAANPDRLAIYNYAHLPKLFMPQRRINEDELPSSDTKLADPEPCNQAYDRCRIFVYRHGSFCQAG